MSPADTIEADRLLTSHQVGSLLQVNPSSVKKWVAEGRITAHRTPGGHRRIRAGDLVEFLHVHRMPIPSRLVGPSSKRRLLLVDDDETYLKGLDRLLKPHRERVEVKLSTSGIEALVRVGSFKPHLIVLDIFMPELDGLEVCRQLKKSSDTASIGVLVNTGNQTPALEADALAAGALACVMKPIAVSLLLEHLGVHLSQDVPT